MEYVELRKPFTLNNLAMQKKLKDRRAVYDLLADAGIDTPRHVYLSRDDYVSTGKGEGNGNGNQEVVEHDDHIEVCWPGSFFILFLISMHSYLSPQHPRYFHILY